MKKTKNTKKEEKPGKGKEDDGKGKEVKEKGEKQVGELNISANIKEEGQSSGNKQQKEKKENVKEEHIDMTEFLEQKFKLVVEEGLK